MNMKIRNRTFTIIELVIVCLIVAVITTIGIPIYRTAVHNLEDSEAEHMLTLMNETQEVYTLDRNLMSCTDTSDCNNILGLHLSDDEWDYEVHLDGSGGYCAQATNHDDNTRVFHREDNGSVTAGACPY